MKFATTSIAFIVSCPVFASDVGSHLSQVNQTFKAESLLMSRGTGRGNEHLKSGGGQQSQSNSSGGSSSSSSSDKSGTGSRGTGR